MSYEFIYRLDDEKLVYRTDLLKNNPGDHIVKTRIDTKKLAETYFLYNSKLNFIPLNVSNYVSASGAFMDGTYVSMTDNSLNCYYLGFRPAESYNLSITLDQDLVLASTAVMAKMSLNNEPLSLYYWCDRSENLEENLGHIRDYFAKREKLSLSDTLNSLMKKHETKRLILNRKNDGSHWAYVGIIE